MRSDRWTTTGRGRKLPRDRSPGPMPRTDLVVISSCIANRSPMSRSYRPVHSCSPFSGAISSAVTRILLAGTPHRALDQVGRVDLARDQPRAQILALERESRIPAQHPIERLQRQRVDQVLGQAVGKIFVGAVAEIGEGKHAHDRGSILRRQVRRALAAPWRAASGPPGSQVQTLTGSSMFLKR